MAQRRQPENPRAKKTDEKHLRSKRRMERRRAQRLPDCEGVHGLLADRSLPADANDLSAYELRILSQGGEDGIVHEILGRAGFPTRRSVEIGCGSNGGNSGLLAACFDYTALMIDGNEELTDIAANLFRERPVTVLGTWITRENVNQLVETQSFAGEIDYLGIDLDGMDYWIWDALTVCEPLLVVVEYNPLLGPSLAATVAYDATFDRHRSKGLGVPSGYYGASIAGLTRLAERRGYRLVATSTSTSNAFFLKEEICTELRALSPEEAWKPRLKGSAPRSYARIRLEGVLRYFADRGWALVEIE